MDPRKVLEVSPEATEDEIRAAYLRKVEEFPPERSPEQFEAIRDAYEALRDPQRRSRLLLAADPEASFLTLLDEVPPERRHVGPEPWLAVMKEKP